MLALLSRVLKLLPGFALIVAVIWLGGPYLVVSGRQPLSTETARLYAIAAVVALWLLWVLLERLRARQASAKLAAAVVRQSELSAPAPPADVIRLREGFEQAVGRLSQRGRGGSLYELPWYVFIGAPGSGKTTALVNSGLHFALDPDGGQGRLRGIGGTRNCDWWFTDEAVFLDTAGRFTTQDSDAASDSTGWREFLALLVRHRKRRPINGVILTVSVKDLLTHGEAVREQQTEAARHRLRELGRELQIQLPVYVMVTMCDLVVGFADYFDDLTQDGRAQVWGVTFPYEQTREGQAAAGFPREFDALVTRLNERLFGRLDDEIDVRRRARIFAFPQQLAALRDPLAQWLADVFMNTTYDQQVLLRGVYFTSGTQEGTPIDRLLGAIGKGFRMAPDAVAPPPGRGKAYFVERLLGQVLIGESGLAGVNRQLEWRKALGQLATYAGLAFLVATGLSVLSVSYARNREYVQDVAQDVSQLQRLEGTGRGLTPAQLMPRLDAVKGIDDSANRFARAVPWSMRWGLYQGRSLGTSARDAYVRELDGVLLPAFAERLRQRVAAHRNQPETLYEFLRAYLMLGQPEHLDKALLLELGRLEWGQDASSAPLVGHLQALLARDVPLRPMPLDPALVGEACRTVERTSAGRIMYSWLRQTYPVDDTHDVRLDLAAGAGARGVLRRTRAQDRVPGFFSRTVFQDITGKALPALVEQFAGDDWVCGRRVIGDRVVLARDLTANYEREYIAAWEAVLKDLAIVPFHSVQEAAEALDILGGPSSPLRALLETVRDHTTLYAAPPPEQAGQAEAPGLSERLRRLTQRLPTTPVASATSPPGAAVTASFSRIHKLFEGAPGNAPIDRVQAQLRDVSKQLQTLGPQVGGGNIVAAATDPTVRSAFRLLGEEALGLPAEVRTLVDDVRRRAEGNLTTGATDSLMTRYRQRVLAECAQVLPGHYPFAGEAAPDLPISDFSRLFGTNGVYHGFLEQELAPLVDRTTRPWRWRSGAVISSPQILARFEAAEAIRETFFGASSTPQLQVTVTMSALDAETTGFALTVHGQTLEYRQGERSAVTWPGQTPGAVVQFQDRTGQPSGQSFQGPWALFRLIEAGAPRQEGATRTALTFRGRREREVRLSVEADSLRNPFIRREWRNFGCGT